MLTYSFRQFPLVLFNLCSRKYLQNSQQHYLEAHNQVLYNS
jgi:hypothetical protein